MLNMDLRRKLRFRDEAANRQGQNRRRSSGKTREEHSLRSPERRNDLSRFIPHTRARATDYDPYLIRDTDRFSRRSYSAKRYESSSPTRDICERPRDKNYIDSFERESPNGRDRYDDYGNGESLLSLSPTSDRDEKPKDERYCNSFDRGRGRYSENDRNVYPSSSKRKRKNKKNRDNRMRDSTDSSSDEESEKDTFGYRKYRTSDRDILENQSLNEHQQYNTRMHDPQDSMDERISYVCTGNQSKRHRTRLRDNSSDRQASIYESSSNSDYQLYGGNASKSRFLDNSENFRPQGHKIQEWKEGDIRSACRDSYKNASIKRGRFDFPSVSDESIYNCSNLDDFDEVSNDSGYLFKSIDSERRKLSKQQTRNDEENKCLVELQSDDLAEISQRGLMVDTPEKLVTLSNDVKQEIAAHIMSLLVSQKRDLTIEDLCDNLKKEMNIVFEVAIFEEFLKGKFRLRRNVSIFGTSGQTGTTFVSPFTSVKLCTTHSNTTSQEKYNCNALHICKFDLLSRCPNINCKFGHDLGTEHNIRVLKAHFLHRLTPKQIKNLIRRDENRNITTVPEICRFYNTAGFCKHEANGQSACQYLHVCRYYVSGNCKFRYCKRSHDLLYGQPLRVLDQFGLQPRDVILRLINRAIMEADEPSDKKLNELETSRDLITGNETKLHEESADRLEKQSDFISLETSKGGRYFPKASSTVATIFVNKGSCTSAYSDSKAETESETESRSVRSEEHQDEDAVKTGNYENRKRNTEGHSDKDPIQSKVSKLPDVAKSCGIVNDKKINTHLKIDEVSDKTKDDHKQLHGDNNKNLEGDMVEEGKQKKIFVQNPLNFTDHKTVTPIQTQTLPSKMKSQNCDDDEIVSQSGPLTGSEPDSIKTAAVYENTTTELMIQDPAVGEDATTKQGQWNWQLADGYGNPFEITDIPFGSLEDKYQQYLKGECELRFQDKRGFFTEK